MPDLDAAVVAALQEDVLTPDLVEDVVGRAVELWGEQHAGLDARRRALEADLRRVGGEPMPTLLDALRARERRRADVRAQLEHVDGLGRAGRPTMTEELRAILSERLESWDGLLRSNSGEARPVLRQLLVGRLVLTPRQLPAGRFYEFTGTATYGPLLSGAVGGLVPPAVNRNTRPRV